MSRLRNNLNCKCNKNKSFIKKTEIFFVNLNLSSKNNQKLRRNAKVKQCFFRVKKIISIMHAFSSFLININKIWIANCTSSTSSLEKWWVNNRKIVCFFIYQRKQFLQVRDDVKKDMCFNRGTNGERLILMMLLLCILFITCCLM